MSNVPTKVSKFKVTMRQFNARKHQSIPNTAQFSIPQSIEIDSQHARASVPINVSFTVKVKPIYGKTTFNLSTDGSLPIHCPLPKSEMSETFAFKPNNPRSQRDSRRALLKVWRKKHNI